MASQLSIQAQQTSRSPAGYTVVWGLLAAIALGYLAVLAARPDIASRLILRPSEGSPDNNFAQRSLSKALAELEAAKAAIGRLEDDAKQLRAVIVALEQRGLTAEARLGALETAQKTPMAVADRAPVAVKPEAERAGAPALAGPATQGTIEERPAKSLRESRPPRVAAAATVATGSIPKPAEPAAAPAGPPVGLLIASGPSLDAVRLSWQLLSETNRSVLRPYEPRYIESSTDGGLFQLIAGPAGTREEAARACERLKARNVRCSVTAFTGQPL